MSKKSDRNDESSEVARISAPAYLQKHAEADQSIQDLQAYRILSRITVIQAMSKSEHKAAFGEGAVMLMPDKKVVAKSGESFLFLPLLFFAEFIKWRDRRDLGGGAVLDRSFDPTSDVAKRAKDPKHRHEVYQGGPSDKPYTYRFVESLNFAGLLLKAGELSEIEAMTPCALSFSKGEYFNGQTFIGEIMKRRIGPGQPVAPLWSQVWRLRTETHRNKAGNEWKGFGYDVDVERPWVTEEEAPKFLELHQQLAADFKRKRVMVDQADLDESELEDEPVAAPAGPQEF
jgi:hypothetical protein